MLRLFTTYGTGGNAWTGIRGVSTGLGSPIFEALSSRTIRFLENNRIREFQTLPAIPIYTAPWWGLASISVDIQEGDVYTNGEMAFLVTGTPDASQGLFQVIPAVVASIPRSLALRAGAAYQAGLRIGAW